MVSFNMLDKNKTIQRYLKCLMNKVLKYIQIKVSHVKFVCLLFNPIMNMMVHKTGLRFQKAILKRQLSKRLLAFPILFKAADYQPKTAQNTIINNAFINNLIQMTSLLTLVFITKEENYHKKQLQTIQMIQIRILYQVFNKLIENHSY